MQVKAAGFPISEHALRFSGQSRIDTWSLRGQAGHRKSSWRTADVRLTLQRVRELADAFPFWQRRKGTGRPPVPERDLMVAFLVRQVLDASFSDVQGYLEDHGAYFGIERVPHHSVMSRKNRSARWSRIWERFHAFVMARTPRREAVVATDATGLSGRRRPWREFEPGLRASQGWVKLHAAVETGTFIVLSYEMTAASVHDSKEFGRVWDKLPPNVRPTRSLADAAYQGEACLAAARRHGAAPLHGVRRDAVLVPRPATLFQKLVSFWRHWPNRAAKLYGLRNHAETAFSMIGERFGHRIRCRSEAGRKNEVAAKVAAHNARMLARIDFMSGI